MTGDSQAAEAAADQHRSEQGRAVATAAGLSNPRPVGRQKAELAPETLRLCAADWARFSEYCAGAGASALPAQPTTVAAFLTQAGPGRAARTRRLAGIDHRHRQHALPCPGADPGVRAALKSGNARVRRGLIQLAWRFLLFQKESALAQWYRARTEGPTGGRKTTIIVALARKLLIALWRLVTVGEIPQGVTLRAVAA